MRRLVEKSLCWMVALSGVSSLYAAELNSPISQSTNHSAIKVSYDKTITPGKSFFLKVWLAPSDSARTLEIEAPSSWRVNWQRDIPPDTTPKLLLVSMQVPYSFPAGQYKLPIVLSDASGNPISSSEVEVKVAPKDMVQVILEDLPASFQDSHNYVVQVKLVNHGNVPVKLRREPLGPEAASSFDEFFELGVGQEKTGQVTIKLGQSTSVQLQLGIRFTNAETGSTYSAFIGKPRYRNLDTRAKTLSVNSKATLYHVIQGNKQDTGWRLEGSQMYDLKNKYSLNYALNSTVRRTLDYPGNETSGFVNWISPTYQVAVGDMSYGLESFVDQSMRKRGAMLRWTRENVSFKGFFARGWDYARNLPDNLGQNREYAVSAVIKNKRLDLQATARREHDSVRFGQDVRQVALEGVYKFDWGRFSAGHCYQITGNYLQANAINSAHTRGRGSFARCSLYSLPVNLNLDYTAGSARFVGPWSDQKNCSVSISNKQYGSRVNWSTGYSVSKQNTRLDPVRSAPKVQTVNNYLGIGISPQLRWDNSLQLVNRKDRRVIREGDYFTGNYSGTISYRPPRTKVNLSFTELVSYYHFYYKALGYYRVFPLTGQRYSISWLPTTFLTTSLQFGSEKIVSYQKRQLNRYFGYNIQGRFKDSSVGVSYQKSLPTDAPFSILTLSYTQQLKKDWEFKFEFHHRKSNLQLTGLGDDCRWTFHLSYNFGLPVGSERQPGKIFGRVSAIPPAPMPIRPVISIDGQQIQLPGNDYSMDSLPLGPHHVEMTNVLPGTIEQNPSPTTITLTEKDPVQRHDITVIQSASYQGKITFYRAVEKVINIEQAQKQDRPFTYEPFYLSDVLIKLENLQTKEILYTLCNSEGKFSFPSMRPGKWRLSIDLDRQKFDRVYEVKGIQDHLDIEPGQTQSVNIEYFEVVRKIKIVRD